MFQADLQAFCALIGFVFDDSIRGLRETLPIPESRQAEATFRQSVFIGFARVGLLGGCSWCTPFPEHAPKSLHTPNKWLLSSFGFVWERRRKAWRSGLAAAACWPPPAAAEFSPMHPDHVVV
jgi:hypothetical protein